MKKEEINRMFARIGVGIEAAGTIFFLYLAYHWRSDGWFVVVFALACALSVGGQLLLDLPRAFGKTAEPPS